MKIYDCFMYFDEDMLLDIRLNILNKYVDKFVIIESKFLHSGREKKLNFNINNFSNFKNKIVYLVMDQPPKGIEIIKSDDTVEVSNKKILDNSLKRENTQRNRLLEGVEEANDEDLIISSDLDEIPDLKNFKHKSKIKVSAFYNYNFNKWNIESIIDNKNTDDNIKNITEQVNLLSQLTKSTYVLQNC